MKTPRPKPGLSHLLGRGYLLFCLVTGHSELPDKSGKNAFRALFNGAFRDLVQKMSIFQKDSYRLHLTLNREGFHPNRENSWTESGSCFDLELPCN